jgi:hypothetical protein
MHGEESITEKKLGGGEAWNSLAFFPILFIFTLTSGVVLCEGAL